MNARGAAVFIAMVFGPGLGYAISSIVGDWNERKRSFGAKIALIVTWPFDSHVFERASAPPRVKLPAAARASINLGLWIFLSMCGWDLGWFVTAKDAYYDHMQTKQPDEVERDAAVLEGFGRWVIPCLPTMKAAVADAQWHAASYRIAAKAMRMKISADKGDWAAASALGERLKAEVALRSGLGSPEYAAAAEMTARVLAGAARASSPADVGLPAPR